MNQLWTWLAALVILLIIGGAYLISKTPFQVDQQSAVRNVVEQFGKELSDVSLLAPKNDVAAQMQAHYDEYVAMPLLITWMNDPLHAPGRLTSSPWPDRIDIGSIEQIGEGPVYHVEGQLIEVTNEGGGIGESPTEALRRPITLTVEKLTEGWRITEVTLGAYPGDGNWKLSESDARGIQFMYAETLPTTYISTAEWPPTVSLEAGDYSCARQDEIVIGDRSLCAIKSSEGAAGSTYTAYDYRTAQGDFIARVKFTLRFPQCMNYDEPQQSACLSEQANFDINGLADRILSSIRMH